MKGILLHTNPGRDYGYAVTLRTAEILRRCGAEVFLSETPGRVPDGLRDFKRLALGSTLKEVDMVISLGGDGTLLRCAGYASRRSKPVLGVNLGNTGMLTELERDELELLELLFQGKYRIDRRMMLRAQILGVTAKRPLFALNDVVISRSATGRPVKLTLAVDGQVLHSFFGDGLIVATPTGSSGYSLSAGGPIVEPEANNLLVTPICAHDLYAHSFVLGADREVSVTQADSRDGGAYVTADGGKSVRLGESDRAVIDRARRHTDIVRLKERNFYGLVRDKLKKTRS